MKTPFLYLLPFLFLPNLGLARPTPFGVLEISDYLIIPYLALVLLGRPTRRPVIAKRLKPLLWGFVVWAALSTVTINLRFEYSDSYYLCLGLLKLGKLALYGLAGYLTCLSLKSRESVDRFHWALLIGGLVLAVSLVLTSPLSASGSAGGDQISGFKATNAVSVMMAILLCYLGGAYGVGAGTSLWRRAVQVSIVVMVIGFAMSKGRGGWIAALVGFGFLTWKQGVRRRTAIALVLLLGSMYVAYRTIPVFSEQVDRTLDPDPVAAQEYGIGAIGVDDGGRVATWRVEAKRFVDHPIMGTGFFHRGGQTRLWETGSHNFWLQMFLELGLVGGLLSTAIPISMWRQSSMIVWRKALRIPTQGALIAGVVGGLGGEYFYGGMVVMTLFLVYSPIGRQVLLPAEIPVDPLT